MNGFLKVFGSIIAAFGVIVAALVVVDKLFNKNRIEGDYLDCDVEGEEEEQF